MGKEARQGIVFGLFQQAWSPPIFLLPSVPTHFCLIMTMSHNCPARHCTSVISVTTRGQTLEDALAVGTDWVA